MKRFFENKTVIVITIVCVILIIAAIVGIIIAACNPGPVNQ